MNAIFSLAGETYTSAKVYAFDSQSSLITERVPITSIVNGTFSYEIPELTVCHIVLIKGCFRKDCCFSNQV
jgi:hypothetical protein